MTHAITPRVYVKHTETLKGRGVFAARAFAAGELVEECPIVAIEKQWRDLPQEIRALVFYWGSLDKPKHVYALALGYGSLYNHNNPANMRREAHHADRTIRFIAARDINVDEELTTNYESESGDIECDDTTWFDQMKIKPIVG